MDARAAVELCIVIIAIIFPKSLFFYILNAKTLLSLSLSLFFARACVLRAAREQTKCVCGVKKRREIVLFFLVKTRSDTLNIYI
jgi:uncharacterized membrane protein YbhN (UPF0104 family)